MILKTAAQPRFTNRVTASSDGRRIALGRLPSVITTAALRDLVTFAVVEGCGVAGCGGGASARGLDGQAFDLGDGQRDESGVLGWFVVGVDRRRSHSVVRARIAAAVTAQAARASMVRTRWRSS